MRQPRMTKRTIKENNFSLFKTKLTNLLQKHLINELKGKKIPN